MIYANVSSIRDPLKQEVALEFYRNQNKDISILTETHINQDQIHYIRNNWWCYFFFTPEHSHTKELLTLLHLSLEGVTEVDTDAKRRFVSSKVTPSNDRVPCVYVPSGHSSREQLDRVISLKEYKIIWEIKRREMRT